MRYHIRTSCVIIFWFCIRFFTYWNIVIYFLVKNITKVMATKAKRKYVSKNDQEEMLKAIYDSLGDNENTGAIALSYPPFFIDDSGAEFHAD